jgi:hypothetical protein
MPGPTDGKDMTFIAAIAVLSIAAATLLVLAGKEALRVNGFPRVHLRTLEDLLHVMSLGFAALNDASARATERRQLVQPHR